MSGDPKEQETQETVIAHPTEQTMISDDNQTQETVILTQNEVVSEKPKKARPVEDDGNVKYEIIRSLGKGGFAWVYLVRNLSLDRLEAMKILNSELNEDEDVINRFVKEARISANFDHPNIVTLYEVEKRGRWDIFKAAPEIMERHKQPFAYFTMSFVEGETATNLIKNKGRLDQVHAIRIAMNTCAALNYAHDKGVIHRDIKPDNILVDRQGKGIVMDFGIAKVMDQTRQTAAGTFMGTARYVSPEQAMGKDIDGRSDIYSLGIALYELATGNVPFNSDQWMTVLYQHINEPPPAPETFYGDIDRDLRSIILKMLEKKPEDRFQTAVEVLRALTTVYRALGGSDLHTEHLDQIATRRDYLNGGSPTEVTEMVMPKRKEPPVRTTQVKAREQGGKGPMVAVVGVLSIVLAVALFFVLKPEEKPPVDPDPDIKPIPVKADGRLLISAFPRGQILEIFDDQGQAIEVEKSELPQILTLPEGSYRLIISYQGRTREETGYVSASLPLSRVNAEFEVEDEMFLLEDMR